MVESNTRLRKILQNLLPRVRVGSEEVLLDGTTALRLEIDPEPTELRAHWIGSGWPQDVREAMADLELPEDAPWPRDLVLFGRRLSPGSIELIEERNGNWADEAGNAEILAPGAIISRRGAAPRATERAISWSRSAIDIGELLLSRSWPEGFGITELAEWTGWSSPRISQLLSVFDRRGWTVKQGPTRGRGARRELVDPGGLLAEWSKGLLEDDDPVVREASRTISNVEEFLRKDLAPALSANLSWALGGWAASEELAPFLTTVPTLQIYVDDEDLWEQLDDALRAADLKEVSEGGRVQFMRANQNLLQRSSSVGGLTVASPPRVYADLLRLGPRGEEAAEHLKEVVIDPLHRRQRLAPPPEQMLTWERSVRERLQERIASSPERDRVGDYYRHGTYSTSYVLEGAKEPESLPEFRRKLRGAVGEETGWPAWQLAEGTEHRARPVDNGIECWFEDTIFRDAAHSDFWRAEPKGRLSLIRGYDEDGRHSKLKPGTGIDLTLPVWRIGECLRHAGRLAASMDADRICFMVRWEGLQGRTLANYANERRSLVGHYECAQSSVTSYITFLAAETEPHLVTLTETLVSPLFEAFDFFEAPPDLYEDEIERMRGRNP
jgi:hypothetical protein